MDVACITKYEEKIPELTSLALYLLSISGYFDPIGEQGETTVAYCIWRGHKLTFL